MFLSVVREKSLFIGPLSGVLLALEVFLTLFPGKLNFIYVSEAHGGMTEDAGVRGFGISAVRNL